MQGLHLRRPAATATRATVFGFASLLMGTPRTGAVQSQMTA
jgi:hypothetical protein